MLDFHVFVLACATKLQNYKHINFQFAGVASYKLQINNYNFTNCKCMFASSQVCKFTSLQISIFFKNYKFTIWQIASACLQVWKITKLPNHQITKLQITKYKTTKL